MGWKRHAIGGLVVCGMAMAPFIPTNYHHRYGVESVKHHDSNMVSYTAHEGIRETDGRYRNSVSWPLIVYDPNSRMGQSLADLEDGDIIHYQRLILSSPLNRVAERVSCPDGECMFPSRLPFRLDIDMSRVEKDKAPAAEGHGSGDFMGRIRILDKIMGSVFKSNPWI
ncbi:MAG: hypothetical protein HY518_03810 [Candidatus Aenigmarchaeota archaeon]|nr:hypothetical protein [Candidatus Aenigmarchaeota archaeon]